MWQANEQVLNTVLQVLHNADSPNNAIQMQVRKKLDEFQTSVPQYNNYLIHILTQLKQESPQVRAAAGLILKNNIRSIGTQISEDLSFIKQCAVHSLGDPLPLVRGTVGIVITTLVSKIGLQQWPDLLGNLVQLVQSKDDNTVEGAFSSLSKICEDSGQMLTEQAPDLVRQLLPILIQFSGSQNMKVRTFALNSVNQFIIWQSDVLFNEFMGPYIQALSARAQDTAGEVRRLVCQAFVMLLDNKADILLPQMNSIAEFMLYAMKDQEESVSLEACEFWLRFAEMDNLQTAMQGYLPTLLPQLLKGMVYSEDDLAILDQDEDDQNVPDRAEDIKPRHHKAKTHAVENGQKQQQQQQQDAEEGELDQDDEEEDEEDDDEVYAEWNLRKCSAATLDAIASSFGDSILSLVLPILNQMMNSPEWTQREAGILALGAIADGCMSGIQPHLPQLLPFLLQNMNDPKPLVKSITCWTLSRYTGFVIDSFESNKASYFEPLLSVILTAVLSNNKRVQEAACSALSVFEEEALDYMVPYLPQLLQVFNQAFQVYQKKNVTILLDSVGTLAEGVGSALAKPEYINLLMPPLIVRWNTLSDDDPQLFPLLECLSIVAAALGSTFEPFSHPIYERCIKLIKQTITMQVMHQQNPGQMDEPDIDFLIVALDLVSGIVQALQQNFSSLLQRVQPSLYDLLLHCICHESPEVRQSAFALIGDLAIHSFATLKQYLPQIMPVLIQQSSVNLVDTNLSAVNNACWAAGEISMQYGQEMVPFVKPMTDQLLAILFHRESSKILQENVAITIGRLSLISPESIAPNLEVIVEPWCRALRQTKPNAEKESAFRGFCRLIQTNPNGLLKSFSWFADAVAMYPSAPQDLRDAFQAILSGVKNMLGAQWDNYYSNFPPSLRERLQKFYNLS
ncbi:hypothetical protein MP228_011607 [Amoeboaphelidium protococcarum]|nr:hypothetical protein MP228_011607 [Amoeboaphelidium protococcarum]